MTDDRDLRFGERHLEATDTARLDERRTLTGDIDRLVLYEERATLDVVREQVGAVTVRKVIREREETIPVILRSECLEIVVHEGAGCVRLGDQELEAGRAYEIELMYEEAVVQKHTVPISEVSFEKRVIEEQHSEKVTLSREVLAVDDPSQMVANPDDLLE